MTLINTVTHGQRVDMYSNSETQTTVGHSNTLTHVNTPVALAHRIWSKSVFDLDDNDP